MTKGGPVPLLDLERDTSLVAISIYYMSVSSETREGKNKKKNNDLEAAVIDDSLRSM